MGATRAIIHLENLRHNLRQIRKRIGTRPAICLAVKADAYGHGATAVANAALESGVQCLAIACIEEGIELRKAGIIAPILLLGIPLPEEIPALCEFGLSALVTDYELIQAFETEAKRQKKKISVHLKIDTGMGRIGCRPEESVGLAQVISRSPWLSLGGVATHFPGSDSEERRFTERQIEVFSSVLNEMKAAGIAYGTAHAANSGAIIAYPDSYFDMVRPGIIAYGYYPSKEQERTLDIRPVMSLETQVTFLKRVPADTPISYSMTYRTREETWIATIPVGYGDGYSRLLSNKSRVMIRGKTYPIVGRICMDQCMVDLGPRCEIQRFERVVLFGPEEKAPDAETIADILGTIPYEITCSVNKRVPRIYV